MLLCLKSGFSIRERCFTNLVLKEQGANLQRPALEKPAVQEGGGPRVYGAEGSHPRALVASGAV